MKKITLLAMLMASFTATAQVILSEDFETATLESGFTNGWTVDGAGWVVNNPSTGTPNYGGAEGIVDPTMGNCSNNYAVVDSDGLGFVSLNTSLVSPVMDLSGYSSGLLLKFNQWHRVYSASVAYIEYSSNNGADWTTLYSYGDAMGASTYDISELEGYSAVQIRFRYVGEYEYWWGIDDISVEVGVLPDAPVPATTPNPGDGATVNLSNDIDFNEDGELGSDEYYYDFTWIANTTDGGEPAAYTFNFGTMPDVSMFTSTAATETFKLYGLSQNTTYYWQIVPANAGGSAVEADCPVWSFTTSSTLSVENVQLSAVVVSPNPVKDILNIDSPVAIDAVNVFNQLGQRVLDVEGSVITNNQIDLSPLNPGVYMVKVISQEKSKTIKVIKE